ncbi:IS110 family RNA-guided transposase [Sabulicella glaciei]|uniref:IS110 family transposase n=1 Tax=Sabulicella glaciei TaxID=2984948 RepID=A0ABT3NZD5_9PROT|nr:IS110 family transposase [Roseococcus sp. MDT2-1-1]MCW8087516.1 IS110 family transposase [Roseococcus sp. MDT2-1-1]
MTTYVGLDVFTRATAICVVDESGEKLWEGQRPTDPDTIAEALRHHPPDLTRVGLETRLKTPWLWRELTERGVPVACLHTRHAKAALSLQMNKTDRNDALGLARLVRSGWYREVPVKALDTHRLRAVLFARQQVVGMATGLVNKNRKTLRTFGIAVGSGKGAIFEAQVRRVLPSGDVALLGLIEAMLRAWRAVVDERMKLERQLIVAAKHDTACRLLATAPGLGAVTAVAFVGAIEDPARFSRSKDVVAFLGLMPRRYQSGSVDATVRISKCGDKLVRKLLFEAAHVILIRTAAQLELKAWAERIAARSGHLTPQELAAEAARKGCR